MRQRLGKFALASVVIAVFGIWTSGALANTGTEILTVTPNASLSDTAATTVTVDGTNFSPGQLQIDQCTQDTGPASCVGGPIVTVAAGGTFSIQTTVSYPGTSPTPCDTTPTQTCFIDAIYSFPNSGGVRAPITFAGHDTTAPVTDTFAVGVTPPVTAGTPFAITLQAMNGSTVDASYTGTHTITWGGGTNAPDGTPPAYPAVTVAFANGLATTSLSATYYNAASASLSATDDSSPAVTGTANFAVGPAAAAALRSSIDTTSVIAGSGHPLTITALDAYGNIDTNYPSAQNLTFTGASAVGAYQPTVAGVSFGTPVPLTFTAGVAGATLILYKAEAPTVDFAGGTAPSAGGLAMAVAPGSAASLGLAPAATTVTAGTPDTTGITAFDPYGNVATGYAGAKSLLFGGAATSPSGTPPTFDGVAFGVTTSVTFSAGTASGVMTLFDAESPTVTVGDGSIAGGGPAMTVNAAAATKLVVGVANGTAIAGSSVPTTIAALDPYGNTDLNYTGGKSLTFSGALPSPNLTNPTFAGTAFGTPTLVTFTNGAASGSMILYKAENAAIHVDDGALHNGALPITVNAAAVSHFALTPSSANQVAGTPFGVDLQALDPYDNHTTYSGTLDWSGPAASPGPVTTSPVYPSSVSFDGTGHATATGITLYKAESPTLTAADHTTPTIKGSAPLTVAAAPASQLKVTPSTASPVAGAPLSVALQALDPYGNTPTNYSGPKTINWSGPATSPGPVATTPTTASPSGLTFSPSGSATATGVKLFKAEIVSLGAADSLTSSISGSAPLNVGPAPASQFATTIDATTVIAGDSHTLTITGLDPYGNVDTNYSGSKSVTFAGASASPNGTQPKFNGTNFGSISVPFAGGVVSGPMILYKAEAPTITVKQGTVTNGSGLAMTVKAAPPATVSFTQQPTEVQAVAPTCLGADPAACFISHYTTAGGVQALAKDAFGNAANNSASITVAIASSPSPGATLGGSLTLPTDVAGKATFANLTLNAIGLGYKLKVTASPGSNPTATSNPFTVAQTLTKCTTSCTGAATDSSVSTLSVSATNVGSGGTASNTLGLAFAPSQRPPGVCAGFVDATLPNGQPINGSYTDVTSNTTTGSPVLTLTWTLLKAILQVQPDNGAAHYNVCLGAVNLVTPSGAGVTPWTTKSGAPAVGVADPNVVDPATGLPVKRFWGIVPDCKSVSSNNPCVVSRGKDTGDLRLVFRVPFPWDPAGALGG